MKKENLPRWVRRLLQKGKASFKEMPKPLDDIIVNNKGKVIYRILKPVNCFVQSMF